MLFFVCKPARLRGFTVLWALPAVLALGGCASFNVDEALAQANREQAPFTQGKLEIASTQAQRDARRKAADALLAQPLSQPDAVQLALVNSPALQAALAQNWAEGANAAQSARLANPTFSFERATLLDEVEFSRRLSINLVDLITLPWRAQRAQQGMAMARLQLASEVVDQVTQVRQAWVQAVAAQQSAGYALQVQDAAQAASELARRMQVAGNFSKLDRARQQAFAADAFTQLALAQNEVTATREALVRALGLDASQAAALKLPPRLPDLPAEPIAPATAGQAAAERLDIRLARSAYDNLARSQGLDSAEALLDIEVGIRRDTVFDNAAGTQASRQGYDFSFKLPLFDGGGARRDALSAQTLAAANRLEATARNAASNLRETYAAYRTAHGIASYYRDEMLPLRQTISEETLLRYNGMFISVFDLLLDTREQIQVVMSAIAADKQFWLADAAFQATLVGRPLANTIDMNPSGR